MTRGTSGFPTEDTVRSFQEAQSLLDNFEKVKRRSGQKDLKVTDVFLLSTKKGLEFVRKGTFKGWWIGVKTAVLRFFGVKTEYLDAEKVMSKAMSILKILPRGVSLGQKKQFYAHMVRTEDQKSGRIPSSEKDVDE